MSLLPARRRAVLLVTTALVATLLPALPLAPTAVAAPAVPAVPAAVLPAPGVAPTTITAGTVATVTGTRCRPGTSSRVYVSLIDSSGGFVVSASAVPNADSRWSTHLTPPVDAAAGRYTVSATCDSYQTQTAYNSRPVTVTASSAAPWTGQTPALPNVPNGKLFDVDCADATHCAAVGSAQIAGIPSPLVETWNGSTWTVVPVAAPTGSSGVFLFSVSCPSTTRCVAVGDTTGPGNRAFVVTSTGTTWTPGVLPPPPGEPASSLDGVSCPTVTTCLAVGSAGAISEGSRYSPAAYRLQGATWTATADPVATGVRTQFTAVSCASGRACVAIGDDYATYPSTPIAQSFDGTSWHTMTLPAPAAHTSYRLAGVDCVAAGACTAVGSIDGRGATQPLVEVLTRGTWAKVRVTTDAATGGGLRSVACVSSTQCTAVGGTSPDQDVRPGRPVVARRVGNTWTSAVVDVAVGSTDAVFAGVSCTDAMRCVAVGDDAALPLAATGDGSPWTDADAAAPAGYVGGEFDAVACSADDACTAGGWSYAADQDATTPLVNRWDGTSWSVQSLPDVGEARIAGVACPSRTLCFAVGALGSQHGGDQQPLLLQWRGGTWTRVSIKLPRGGTGVFEAVACQSTMGCLAVGQTRLYGGDPLALALTGTRWDFVTPPDVRLQSTTLSSVSCVAAGCQVIASGYDDQFVNRSVEVPWDGLAFSTGSGLSPSDAVSCVSRTDCAVTPSPYADDEPRVYVQHGPTAEAEPLAYPTTGGSGNVNGIACRGSLTCVVVGSAVGGAFVARRDTAGTWTQQPVAVPGYQELEGVACPSDTRCVAVGHDGGPTIVVSPTG